MNNIVNKKTVALRSSLFALGKKYMVGVLYKLCTHIGQEHFLPTGHLHLGHAEYPCGFGLGQAFEVAQLYKVPVLGGEFRQDLP